MIFTFKLNWAEGEDILSRLNKFKLIATNNNWTKEKQDCSIPLYLDKSALIYCNSLPEQATANQQFVKQALRTQYHSSSKQWQLCSELYALTQIRTLSQYIDHLKILCQRLNIIYETKLYNFANELKPQLEEALLLRQPPDCNSAVPYAELKDSTSANNYVQLLKQIKQLTHTNTPQEPLAKNLNFKL